jgi:hypothetical protein
MLVCGLYFRKEVIPLIKKTFIEGENRLGYGKYCKIRKFQNNLYECHLYDFTGNECLENKLAALVENKAIFYGVYGEKSRNPIPSIVKEFVSNGKCFMEFDCLNGSPVVDIDEGKIAPVELRKATVFKKMRKCVKQLVDGEQRTIGG